MEPFRPAYTVDTLGLPAVTNVSGDPAAKRQAAVFREILGRDLPAPTTQDRYAQAQIGFKDHVYLAISTLMDWMSACSVTVQTNRPKRLDKSVGGAAAESSDYAPVPDGHPCAELFASPNPSQTTGDYVAQRTMCRALFGLSLEYVVRNGFGDPVELHCVLPQYAQAFPASLEYPFGGYRVSLPNAMYGLSAGSTILDGRDVLAHRMPNPMFAQDGYSPLTAGGRMVDVLNSVIESRKNAMDNGFSPETIIAFEGIGEDELRLNEARIKARFTGGGRGSKVMLVAGKEISASPLSTTPDKMDFGGTYKDAINFVMALFGVPPALAGLTETTSFASLFASVKQFTTGKLGSEARRMGQFLTARLVKPTWPDCKLCVDVPTIEDETNRLAQLNTLAAANAVTINELRKAANMRPMLNADVPPAKWNQQFAPEPAAAPDAAAVPPDAVPDADDPMGQPDESGAEDGDAHAFMGSVMQGFGIGPGQLPRRPDSGAGLVKSLTRWLKSFDEGKHNRDGGKFSHTKGAGAKAKAEPDLRPNADLDEAFGAPPDAKQKPATDIRKNDLLDDAFGESPKSKTADSSITPAEYAEYRGLQNAYDTGRPLKPAATARLAHLDGVLKSTAADQSGAGDDAGSSPTATPPKGNPVPIPSQRPSDLSDEFDERDGPASTLPPTDDSTRAYPTAPEAARAAQAAAKNLDAETLPIAKRFVAKLKALPVARPPAGKPKDWLPKMLKEYLPIFIKAMRMRHGAATKLLIFGAMAALHHATKNAPEEPAKKPPVLKPVADQGAADPLDPKPYPADGPKPPRPKNPAGKGSLPGRMGKSVFAADWQTYFAGLTGRRLRKSADAAGHEHKGKGEGGGQFTGGAHYDAAAHPEDDTGRLVSKHDLQEAAVNPKKADALRATITDPAQLAKFDARLAAHRAKPSLSAGRATRAFLADHLTDHVRQAAATARHHLAVALVDKDADGHEAAMAGWGRTTRLRLLGLVKAEAERGAAQLGRDYPHVDPARWDDLHDDLMRHARATIGPAVDRFVADQSFGDKWDGLARDVPTKRMARDLDDAAAQLTRAVAGLAETDPYYAILKRHLDGGVLGAPREHKLGRFLAI